jgi:hypothetical protein
VANDTEEDGHTLDSLLKDMELDSARSSFPVKDIVEDIGTPERTIQRCQKADVSKMSDSQMFYSSDVQNLYRLETDGGNQLESEILEPVLLQSLPGT